MPFTPFHMGAALIVKPAARHYFSLLTYGMAQIALDIEPGIGMALGWSVLHGPSHTILGALLIAGIVAWLAPWLCNPILHRYNREARYYGQDWLLEPDAVSRTAAMIGAFFGTLSHLFLDSLMHHDIHPLAPFTDANPMLDLVSHDGVYQMCTLMGLIGMFLWIHQKWATKR
jgi:membrane-bound metal-dependent hydrolase YbcI (DUF457 family)